MTEWEMATYRPSRWRPSAITEDDLIRGALGYGERAVHCLCGGVVVADERDPGPGVRRHRATERHAAWSEAVYG